MAKSPKKDFPSSKETEWKGQYSQIKTYREVVAKTQAEWESLWKDAHSSQSPIPKAPALPEGKMAVAVFYGQTSANINLSVDSVTTGKNALDVKWSSAGTPSMLAVMREPYVVKLVDSSPLPVVFTKAQAPTQKRNNCRGGPNPNR